MKSWVRSYPLPGAFLVAQWQRLSASEGDMGSIPGSGRSPGEGNGDPLWSSCLGNPMNRGPWWATAHGGHKELDMTQ